MLETAKSHIQTKEPLLVQAGQVSHPNSKSWEFLQYMGDALLKSKLQGWTKHRCSAKDFPMQTWLPQEAENRSALEKSATGMLKYK